MHVIDGGGDRHLDEALMEDFIAWCFDGDRDAERRLEARSERLGRFTGPRAIVTDIDGHHG